MPYRQVSMRASIFILALWVLLTLFYSLFGHRVVKALYDGDLPAANLLMSAKANTPLGAYFAAADKAMFRVSKVLIFVAVVLLLSRNLLGIVLSAVSFFAVSLAIFAVLDVFPPLVTAMHFDLIPYYAKRLTDRPDAELGFIEKPFNHTLRHNFRGWAYSSAYGFAEPGKTILWETDEQGFRNRPGISRADVVIIGSSFPGYGTDLADAYAGRLEKHLNGCTVANLGMGGYSPVEFLKVYRRFGLPKKPRYAILPFNMDDTVGLEEYITGKEEQRAGTLRLVFFGSFWSRWKLVERQTLRLLGTSSWMAFQTAFRKMGVIKTIHPDVAVLSLPGNRREHTIFLSKPSGLPPEELLNSATWRAFAKILMEFKQISDEHQIVPVLAYIPWKADVYAEYSTTESGANWLVVRQARIAAAGSDEIAARRLAERAGIKLISFLPAFRDAARHGRFVYYRFDNHWNSEGSEIAASVTADALKAQVASTSDSNPLCLARIADSVSLP